MRETSTLEPQPEMKKNRRDHYIPQGYLRGFINPGRLQNPRPLWFFDVPNSVWSERSPREICYRPGFLLCFMQMMRARSLLFFEETQREGKDLRAFTIEEVSSDRMSVKLRSMTPEPLPDHFIRNWTITKMREDIDKGASWLMNFHWCLRYCDSPDTPFVISEAPLMESGRSENAINIFRDRDALLFFPLCWQACLMGSVARFDQETGRFGEEDMRRVVRMYREAAKLFVLGPRKIDFC